MFRNPLVDAAVVLIVVLLIFGPKRLPMLGRSLGQGMREFKDSITGHHEDEEEAERPALTPAAETPPPAAAPSAAAPSVPERESAELGSRESGS
jgi:sec-independent protein translocase protein TatA